MGSSIVFRMKQVTDLLDKKLSELRRQVFSDCNKLNESVDSKIDEKTNNFKNYLETRLIEFHKEVSDRYFSSLENILRTNREISLIESLAGHIKKEDLQALETSLLQPVLEQRWKQENKEQVDKVSEIVESKGAKIIERKKYLHEKYLELNRQNKNTSDIEREIAILDWIIGGAE